MTEDTAKATLNDRIVALAGDGFGPVSFVAAFRDGEWSAAVTWKPTDPSMPTSAHANGDTLEQAADRAMTDAERLVTVSGSET